MNEFRHDAPENPNEDRYALVSRGVQFLRPDGTMVEMSPSAWASSAIGLSDQLCPGIYLGDMPAGAEAGYYNYTVRVRMGPVRAPGDPEVDRGYVVWGGDAEITPGDTDLKVTEIYNTSPDHKPTVDAEGRVQTSNPAVADFTVTDLTQ